MKLSMNIKWTALAITSMVCILSSLSASAQNQGRWYKAEVLIFKRLQQGDTNEHWPQEDLSYPENTQYVGGGDGTLRAANNSSLNRYAYSLKKSEDYKVLFHKAWKQKMRRKGRSPAIAIKGGEDLGGRNELDGTLTFHIGRYLHIDTDLWLSDPNIKTDVIVESEPAREVSEGNFGENYSFPSLGSDASYPAVTLRQHRRMRSRELHYIDHPMMGMLVYLTPL